MYLFEDYSPQSIIFAIVFGRFLNRTFMEMIKSNLYGIERKKSFR